MASQGSGRQVCLAIVSTQDSWPARAFYLREAEYQAVTLCPYIEALEDKVLEGSRVYLDAPASLKDSWCAILRDV